MVQPLASPDSILTPTSQNSRFDASAWLRYFDPRAAVNAVYAHVETLPGARTPERHTARAYADGLRAFLDYARADLPTEDLMNAFVAALLGQGLKPVTVRTKYLAPVRLYLKKLAGQRITGFTGAERDYIHDCCDHLRAAAAVPTPRPQTTTSISPLWNPQFTRLTLQQVNAVLRAMDRSKRAGLRDYALLHVAFSSGLRLAELQRMTLSAIAPHADGYLVTVRGKRSNVDPVPISAAAYGDMAAWVDAYNAGLHGDTALCIEADTPLWQPLRPGDHYAHNGVNGFTPQRGLSKNAIAVIIRQRTGAALGVEYELAAHDTRRTCAAIAYDSGMSLPDIQALLRHQDAAVTLRYVGTKPDFASRALSTYVTFG